jgi:hypothetical protein
MTSTNSQIRWFYKVGDNKSGPVTDDALRDLFANNGLPLDTRVWRDGVESWLPARDVQELFPNGVPLNTSLSVPPQSRKWLHDRPAIPIALAGLAIVFAVQILWGFVSWLSGRGEHTVNRLAVSGIVTLDGEPLEGAIISFRPMAAEPFGARVSIDSGDFRVPRQKGLTAGTYTVRINKHVPAQPPEDGGDRRVKPGVELIPPRYNATTELTAEIPKSGKYDLRFELQTK